MIFSSNFTKLHATKITIYQEGKVKINQDKTLNLIKIKVEGLPFKTILHDVELGLKQDTSS